MQRNNRCYCCEAAQQLFLFEIPRFQHCIFKVDAFLAVTDPLDNILEVQEFIYQYVVVLDKYFSHVSELDIVFNFEKATFILDEMLLGGYYQEISHKNICKAVCEQDEAHDESEPQSLLNILEEMSLISTSMYKKR